MNIFLVIYKFYLLIDEVALLGILVLGGAVGQTIPTHKHTLVRAGRVRSGRVGSVNSSDFICLAISNKEYHRLYLFCVAYPNYLI